LYSLAGTGGVPDKPGLAVSIDREPGLQQIVSPMLLYLACGLGAVGVLLALPRKNVSPFVVGALVGAIGIGLLFIGLAASHPDHTPNIFFYAFSGLALLSALRVITHPRPVYSALYFVLTILSSCGLYLILSAEFLAFALVIVYAGAILITYLFVIMLATEGPTAEAVEALTEYDRVAREPVYATVAGLLLLCGLTTLMAAGSVQVPVNERGIVGNTPLVYMPRQVERLLSRATAPGEGAVGRGPVLRPGERLARLTPDVGAELQRLGLVTEEEIARAHALVRARSDEPGYAINPDPVKGWLALQNAEGQLRVIRAAQFPPDLQAGNTVGVAFAYIDAHPGSIEVAGVILLMAMVGAVILARKKVEMDEQAKASAAAREHDPRTGDPLGLRGVYVAPGVGEGGTPA
jgi:NADH-quinone oxidoreductase subunit J